MSKKGVANVQGPVIPGCTITPAACKPKFGACENEYFGALGACGKSQRSNYSKSHYFEAFGACEKFVIFYLYFEKQNKLTKKCEDFCFGACEVEQPESS